MKRNFMKKETGKRVIAAAAAAVMMCSPVVSNVHASDSLINRAKANEVVLGQYYGGELGENGAKDDTSTYTFTLNDAGAVTINQNVRNKKSAYATLYNEDGNYVCRLSDSAMYLSAGIYYIVFVNYGTSPCEYTLSVTTQASGESFKETVGKGNDTLATASPIAVNTQYTGQVDITDENDWYKFVIPSRGSFKFDFYYDNTKATYEPVKYDFTDSDGNAFDPKTSIDAGTYYIKFYYAGDYGSSYHFKLNYKAYPKKVGKTSITSLKASKTSIKLKYKKASNAQKYQISYAANKKFSKVKTITTKSTSYTVKKLKKNTKYYFRIRSIRVENGKNKYGSYSAVKTAKTKK